MKLFDAFIRKITRSFNLKKEVKVTKNTWKLPIVVQDMYPYRATMRDQEKERDMHVQQLSYLFRTIINFIKIYLCLF